MPTTVKSFNPTTRRFEDVTITTGGSSVVTTTTPATTVDDSSVTTTFFGGNTSALGTPDGWVTTVVPGVVDPISIPYYRT
jgi:hypothetical protein